MLKTWFDLTRLGVESQRVIALRMMRLAGGGAKAGEESRRMVAEKFFAAAQASNRMLFGDPPGAVIAMYRRRVRANAKRLLR